MTVTSETQLAVTSFDWATAALAKAGRKPSPEGIHAAAVEFEALLIGQMLRSIREAGGGAWLSGDEQDAAFSLMEMAEQCLATVMAAQGGLGLAGLIEQSLAASSPSKRQYNAGPPERASTAVVR
jgi:flagellar protein FlgJ